MVEDAEWNRRVRDETDAERLDRNWSDLLQELRVAQTGVQLLTRLLLTAPATAWPSDGPATRRAAAIPLM